jgi:malate permease and related proteins
MGFNDFYGQILIIYIILFIGFIANKKHILPDGSNRVLTQLILYISLPALIIFSMDTTFSKALMIEATWLVIISVYILSLVAILARYFRRLTDLPQRQAGVFEALFLFGSQGFIGYAVVFIIFGELGVMYTSIFNIYYLILIWTYGIYLVAGTASNFKWSMAIMNPGILATLTGLLILLTPIKLPNMLSTLFFDLGSMTVPLTMLLVGSLLADTKINHLIELIVNKYIWYSSLFKCVVMPLLLLPFVMVQGFTTTVLLVAVVISAMPAAPTTSIYAVKYNADTAFASVGVCLSTIMSVITIPFIYFIYLLFL